MLQVEVLCGNGPGPQCPGLVVRVREMRGALVVFSILVASSFPQTTVLHVGTLINNFEFKGDSISHWQDGIFQIANRKNYECEPTQINGLAASSPFTLQLKGGMGKILSMADKFYKKRNAPIEKAKRKKNEEKKDLEEIAEEFRGLPLEERMELAMADSNDEEVGDGADHVDKTMNNDEEGGDEEFDDGGAEAEGEAVEWAGGAGRGAAVRPQPSGEEHVDVGALVQAAGEMRLRTQPCSGDAWAGLFFDVEAKGPDAVEVRRGAVKVDSGVA